MGMRQGGREAGREAGRVGGRQGGRQVHPYIVCLEWVSRCRLYVTCFLCAILHLFLEWYVHSLAFLEGSLVCVPWCVPAIQGVEGTAWPHPTRVHLHLRPITLVVVSVLESRRVLRCHSLTHPSLLTGYISLFIIHYSFT